jgi:replicative DNA helicase
MGKTALALDIALNVMAARGGVIIYTFEMLRSEIADRLAAKQTHIYPIRLKKGSLDDYQILQYEELVRKNKTAPIIVDDRHATDTDLISRTDTHLNTLSRAEVPLDLIVVDHLHVMGSRDHRHTSEKAKLEAYTHSLKQLAKDHNCAVLLLSQVTQEASRRLDDPLPRISDFRGASAMREDANIALGLYLPHKDSPEVAPNLAKVVILKNRDGDTGLVSLKWVGQFMQFTNTERWDEEGM